MLRIKGEGLPWCERRPVLSRVYSVFECRCREEVLSSFDAVGSLVSPRVLERGKSHGESPQGGPTEEQSPLVAAGWGAGRGGLGEGKGESGACARHVAVYGMPTCCDLFLTLFLVCLFWCSLSKGECFNSRLTLALTFLEFHPKR